MKEVVLAVAILVLVTAMHIETQSQMMATITMKLGFEYCFEGSTATILNVPKTIAIVKG